EALWDMLRRQKATGKVRHLGISILGKGSEFQAQHAKQVGAEVLQVIYNRLDQRPNKLYFPSAGRDNLGILARVPLASGVLTGKYRPGTRFAEGDVRSTFDPKKLQSDLETAEHVRREEVPEGVAMNRWALAWCLKNPLVTAVIPGCKSVAQVIE